MHDIFTGKWEYYKRVLDRVYPRDVKRPTRKFDAQKVNNLLHAIETAVENMDVDNADEAMNAIGEYDIDTEKIEALREAVVNLDEDAVKEIAAELKSTTTRL